MAGATLLDLSEGAEEETEAEEAAAALIAVVNCRRCCWELFGVVTARALAELDAAAKRGIRDGTAALRAERRSIVKLVERDDLSKESEREKKRERRAKIVRKTCFFSKLRPEIFDFCWNEEQRNRGEAHALCPRLFYLFRDLR